MGGGNKPVTVMCKYVFLIVITVFLPFTMTTPHSIPIPAPLSDGMGHTGAFIFISMDHKVEGVVDIFDCIKTARICRPYLVQNVVSPPASHHYIIIPPVVML